MPDRSRRNALQALAAGALPLAGCLDRLRPPATDATSPSAADRPGSPTAASSPTPPGTVALDVGETHEAPDGTTVTVRDVRVRKLLRSTSVGSPTHVDVACLPDHQFAVVDAEATDAAGDPILPDVRFALVADGVRYPRPDRHWYWAVPPGSHDRPGFPAFPVPVADAAGAAVVWRRDPPVRWTLPADTVEQFGRAPAFAVRSFETPDAVARGGVFEVAFAVANAGGRDGRFVAELGAGVISDHDEVVVDVPHGTERTFAETVDPVYVEEADEVGVTFDWGCGRLRRTVRVDG